MSSKFYKNFISFFKVITVSLVLASIHNGHFTFWISLSLRPKTETKRLSFGLSPNLGLSKTLSERLIQKVK